jgi:hypothetical protein
MPQRLSHRKPVNQFAASLPPYLKRLLPRSAVLSAIAWAMPDLRVDVANAIERDWQLSTGEIKLLGLGQVPTEVENIMIAHGCAEMFSPELLTPDVGFYSFFRRAELCDYCAGECKCSHLPAWRLDIDPQLSRTGIIVPVREPRYRWIVDLVIFRSTRDSRPFPLRVRKREALAA